MEELTFIESWKHLKNPDGTQCYGDKLTIIPSEIMDMKLDVSNSVVIKDNYLTFNDKILTIQRYLYGGGYINDGWKYSQVRN